MDDLFHGTDTIEQYQNQIKNIINTLEAGKLPLTKWVSNDNEVLKYINDKDKISAYINFDDQSNSTIKTLGLIYCSGFTVTERITCILGDHS